MSGHDPTYRVEWRMTLDDPVSEKGGCVGYAGSELARALYAWEGLDPIEAFRTLRAQTGCASFGFAVVCEQDGLVKALQLLGRRPRRRPLLRARRHLGRGR